MSPSSLANTIIALTALVRGELCRSRTAQGSTAPRARDAAPAAWQPSKAMGLPHGSGATEAAGACGLKHHARLGNHVGGPIAPFAGVWIENQASSIDRLRSQDRVVHGRRFGGPSSATRRGGTLGIDDRFDRPEARKFGANFSVCVFEFSDEVGPMLELAFAFFYDPIKQKSQAPRCEFGGFSLSPASGRRQDASCSTSLEAWARTTRSSRLRMRFEEPSIK